MRVGLASGGFLLGWGDNGGRWGTVGVIGSWRSACVWRKAEEMKTRTVGREGGTGPGDKGHPSLSANSG
jgi:hypothetical protein